MFNILKRHFSRYTPEVVSQICGVDHDLFLQVSSKLAENSGRERTSAFCYAVGWTQHTVGVQYIRTAAILQLLLGNIGRPGGGILALRGHATIQGSTDVPTLYNLLPGYLPMPKSESDVSLGDYVDHNQAASGWWGEFPKYFVSLLKAYFGERATAANDYCFDYLPRLTGDHSHMTTVSEMADGKVKRLLHHGREPHRRLDERGTSTQGDARARLDGRARLPANRDRRVLAQRTRDRRGGVVKPEDIKTEVFFFPGGLSYREGWNLHEHPAITPMASQGGRANRRRAQRAALHVPPRSSSEDLVQELTQEARPSDQAPDMGVSDGGCHTTSRSQRPCSERSTATERQTADPCRGSPSSPTMEAPRAVAGSTRARSRRASIRRRGESRAESSPGSLPNGAGRGLPTAVSSTTEPPQTPMESRGPSASATCGGTRYERSWTGEDVADFIADRPPSHRPKKGRAVRTRSPETTRSSCWPDGKGWLVRAGGIAGWASAGALRTAGVSSSQRCSTNSSAIPPVWSSSAADNRYHRPFDDERFPFVVTTYRLTEHHTAGGMSRWVSWLSELQPEMFCEVSNELRRNES